METTIKRPEIQFCADAGQAGLVRGTRKARQRAVTPFIQTFYVTRGTS